MVGYRLTMFAIRHGAWGTLKPAFPGLRHDATQAGPSPHYRRETIMGFEMRDAFVRREECKAAWASEVEFAEMARVLKSLAAEFGQEATPAIDELAHHGIGAALGVLANQTGADVEGDYLRCRARQRLAPDRVQ